MDPFRTLEALQDAYQRYVESYQQFKNPAIREWVLEKVRHGNMLYQQPHLQLARRFQPGDSLRNLVDEGLLHPGVLSIFTTDRDDRHSPPIAPHRHQVDAIRRIQGERKTTIVATGTGSGKSFCFGIPIVSECQRLKEQGVPGIKALIIYPLNALGNSQSDDFARRLAGSGRRGADVACLIRRLKQHTGVTGSLRCIATSATVQAGVGESAQALITEFATRLFGEPFEGDAVIGETYELIPDVVPAPLSDMPAVDEGDIVAFDTSTEERALGSAAHLAGKLLGRTVQPGEVTFDGLGIALRDHPALLWLEQHLLGAPHGLRDLQEQYADELRPGVEPRAAGRELLGALLAGTVARVRLGNSLVPRFVLKVHAFFSQGGEIASCLTPALHLSEHGDTVCSRCVDEGHPSRAMFPLVFCNSCGHEFFGVAITEEGELTPRDIDDVEGEGQAAYICPTSWDPDQVTFPERWLTKTGNLQRRWSTAPPVNQPYCPDHNRQDTALQAAHLNNLQRLIAFRRALYRALLASGAVVGEEYALGIDEAGKQAATQLERSGLLPNAVGRAKSRYASASAVTRDQSRYQEYLAYATLFELRERGLRPPAGPARRGPPRHRLPLSPGHRIGRTELARHAGVGRCARRGARGLPARLPLHHARRAGDRRSASAVRQQLPHRGDREAQRVAPVRSGLGVDRRLQR
jgi:hypothetical protein